MTLNKKNYLKRSKHFKNVLIYHGMGMDKKLAGTPLSRVPLRLLLRLGREKDYLRYKHYSHGFHKLAPRVVQIGHLRSDRILNREYDAEGTLARIGIRDRGRKNIVYAPTWSRGHGSLKAAYETLCREVSQEHNLILRAHPYDLKNYERVRALIQKEKLDHVYLVDPNQIDLIDNLAIADLLIGENSSLMYDWIFFDKPVILVKTPNRDLEKAGLGHAEEVPGLHLRVRAHAPARAASTPSSTAP